MYIFLFYTYFFQLEKEEMRPGIVLDGEPPIATSSSNNNKYTAKNQSFTKEDMSNRNDNPKPSINCFAAILLGIKCEIEGIDENTQKSGVNSILPVTSPDSTENLETESGAPIEILESSDNDKIVTVKEGLLPDRDEVFLNKPLLASTAIPVPLEVMDQNKNKNITIGTRTQMKVTSVTKQ